MFETSLGSHKILSGNPSQMSIDKQKGRSHATTTHRYLKPQGAQDTMVGATPESNVMKQSPRAHELARDVKAARVDQGDARRMTRVGYDPCGQ